MLRRGSLLVAFQLASELDPVLKLLHKYADVPISLADACLVRMTEILPDPILLTTDSDFGVYRRHSRQVVPARRHIDACPGAAADVSQRILNSGMSGREPHMQNDSGANGNWRGRCEASSSIDRTPVEYSYTIPSGPSK